jgi:hypothetical protein
VTRSFVPQDNPDINFVRLWFEFQIGLVDEERRRVLRTFQPSNDTGVDARRAHEWPLIGLPQGEVEEFFEAQRGELELLTMFELLATTEAILRIEFKDRVAARKAAMKEEGVAAKIISAFRGTLRLRHWLAHGRHWHPKLGRGYAPGDVFDIARALIESIPPS